MIHDSQLTFTNSIIYGLARLVHLFGTTFFVLPNILPLFSDWLLIAILTAVATIAGLLLLLSKNEFCAKLITELNFV